MIVRWKAGLLECISKYYRAQGWAYEAEKLAVEVLELRKGVLGDEHPLTICGMEHLAASWFLAEPT